MRVLQSFPEPRPTTNPYVVMLRRALADHPDVEVLTFRWSRALLGRYDVFHVHWPEILVAGRTPARALARRALFLALLLRLRLTATPIVRTVHNLRPQEGVSGAAALLLRLAERWTTLLVHLNGETPPSATPSVTIPHGHYRDWFAAFPQRSREAGRLAFVGLIRPYKNVTELIRVFRATGARAPGAVLEIAGRPAGGQSAEALLSAADGDPRIALRPGFLTDEQLVETVTRAQLVVLPYREMHNSGAALMALSLDRPVLVPENEVNAALAAEVGAAWVLRYPGELTADALLAASAAASGAPGGQRPDLARRDWTRAGADHLAAYRRALAIRRGA